MRRSEVLQLSKADVDMDRGVIHVIKTKSKQTRIIPLNRISRSIVESLDVDMFHRLNANHISRKFNSYLKTANLSQFKLHSLRHTFATNLIHLGVDVYTVSRLLGHSDIRTTLIYAKMKVEVMKEAVNRLTPDPVALPAEKISS